MNLAQCVMPAFRFGVNDPKEAEKLVQAGVSGFCLYGGTASEVTRLTTRLQAKATLRLLFASDFENGAGSQMKDMTEFPSNMAVGVSGNIENARMKGAMTAQQAKAVGINWIFAPVVDLSIRGDNPIVSIRSFGSDPQLVTHMARAYLQGLQSEGVAGCLKHFPGHGDTSVDSHVDLARIETNWKTLYNRDLNPYALLANEAGAIMTGHLVLKEKDAKPASLSEYWIQNVLRQDLRFRGVVITDALMMGAIEKRFGQEKAICMALEAGSDILLYPNDPWAAIKTIKQICENKQMEEFIGYALKRIHCFRGQIHGAVRPMDGARIQSMSKKHFQAAMQMAREGLAWINPPKQFDAWAKGPLLYEEYGNRKAVKGAPAAVRLMHDKMHSASLELRLKQAGLPPSKAAKTANALLIAIFHKPKAFAGELGLSSAEISAIQKLLKQPCDKKLAISFGDPYLLKKLPATLPALSAFSDCEASQAAAIEILLGKNPPPQRRFNEN